MEECIESMMIYRSKFMADGAKYFELFENYVPRGILGNVLAVSIGNLDCLEKTMSLNKDAKHVVVDNGRVIKCLAKLRAGRFDVEGIEDDGLDLYNKMKDLDMKFDCIIMNPPYSGNLHLKILAEAIKHLKDEKSVCVNLSPVRWLQDPLAKFKKTCDLKRFEENVIKHIEKLDIISSSASQSIFNIGIQTDIGIYFCKKTPNIIFDSSSIIDKIVKKVVDKLFQIKQFPVFEKNKYDGWRVRIPVILGGKTGDGHGRAKITDKHEQGFGKLYSFFNGQKDGKMWYDWYQRNQFTKTTKEITLSIKFNSENEANNFINQYSTNFCRYILQTLLSDVHVAPEKMIWMSDYAQPWTDERFYKFFNISPEEQKVIEDTMAKYR